VSWKDRDEHEDGWRRMGRPGGDWQGIRPTFDNPMTWALPLGRYSGIAVRVHIFFLLFIVVMLLRSIAGPAGEQAEITRADFPIVALLMVVLFLVVLLHEFGHCIACRFAGGEADEILMWPLGGLAYCRPENRWKSHLVTAVGGPAVNVAICLVAGVMLGLITGQWLGVALPNPLSFDHVLYSYGLGRPLSWPVKALMVVNWLSLVLLLFNLLPIFPLDGGRIVQALLWRRIGYVGSMRIAVRIGYIGAIGLGLWGAVIGNWLLLGIAVFGGVTCYMTHRQVQFAGEMMGEASDGYAASLFDGGDPEPEPPSRPSLAERRAARKAQVEASEDAHVDRILAKIAETGMDSLTGKERKLLQRVTERQRTTRR
jgi:Zn-dependent protease